MRLSAPWRRSLSPTLAGTFALLRLLPRVSRARTALLAAGVLAGTLLPLGATVVAGLLVGSVPAAVRGGLASAAGRASLSLLVGAGALIVAERLLTPFLAALAGTFGRAVDRCLQERVMAAIGGPSGVAHLEDPAILDLIETARGVGAEGTRPGAAVTALASLLPSWFQALGSALILALFHWWLALVWVVAWPVVTYYFQREYVRVGEVASGQAGAVRRAEYYHSLALDPGAAKELRIWGMLDWLIARFEDSWRRAMEPTWRARNPGRPVLWVSTGVVAALNLGSFGLLAWAAARGEINLAALAVYTQALLGANNFRAFDDVNTQLAYAAVSVPGLLALERRLGDNPALAPAAVPARVLPPGSPREGIRFENVAFRYPGRPERSRGSISPSPPGGPWPSWGPTGPARRPWSSCSAASTTPPRGASPWTAWTCATSTRAPGSGGWPPSSRISRGITCRRATTWGWAPPNCWATRSPCARRRGGPAPWTSSSRCRADGTPCSRASTRTGPICRGASGSVSRWRARCSRSRAARVLILDEPTASLDVRAEAALYDRFLDITAGLTTILISHRFSTVRRADRIVVLDGGGVAEQGTHDELVALEGRYAEMFALQAARFVDEATPDAARAMGGGE